MVSSLVCHLVASPRTECPSWTCERSLSQSVGHCLEYHKKRQIKLVSPLQCYLLSDVLGWISSSHVVVCMISIQEFLGFDSCDGIVAPHVAVPPVCQWSVVFEIGHEFFFEGNFVLIVNTNLETDRCELDDEVAAHSSWQ